MPKMNLPFERGGRVRIGLSWGLFGWRNFTVKFDGQEVGRMEGQRDLASGRDFPLPDGSTLRVQLIKKVFTPELQVMRNGTPLPGSGSDPRQKLKAAGGIVFFVGGFNVLLGLAALSLKSTMLQGMGIGAGSIAVGAVFLLLGFFVMRRSAIALGLSIALLVVDAALTMLYAVYASGNVPTAGLVMRVFFIIFLWRGFSAIKELKAAE